MARRMKNASSWLDDQRRDRVQFSKEIRKHSRATADELDALDRESSAKALFAHPERFIGSREAIKEYMDALRDIHAAILREKMRSLGGPSEESWPEREEAKRKAKKRAAKRAVTQKRTKLDKPRPERAKSYTDPSTGEKLYIVESVKELGDNVAGVTYDIHKVKTDKGLRYRFNVTKRGRQILDKPGAPPLYNHPDEKRLFRLEEDAILRARRVIHASLIWYEERRGQFREIEEKKRRAGARKKELERREARTGVARKGRRLVEEGSYEAEVLGLEPGTQIKDEIKITEARKIRREAEEKEGKRKRKRMSRVKPGQKQLHAAWETGTSRRRGVPSEVKKGRKVEAKVVGGKFRTPKKLLKGNPFFGGEEDDRKKQAKSALAKYKSEFSSFQRSLRTSRPKFEALMRSYDQLENARANYSLADMESEAMAVNDRMRELRDAIVSFMESDADEVYETAYGMRNPSNPSTSSHQKIGAKALKQSETAWDRYCKTLHGKDLLTAYMHLVVAERELGYAKDKKGVTQAKAGLKAARAELTSRLKKGPKKASKKKASKKKAK